MPANQDSQLLVDHTVASVLRVVGRMRFLAAAFLGVLAVLFQVHDAAAWKPLAAGLAAMALLALAQRDLRRRGELYRPAEVVALLASILAAQLLAIILTGGIRSPLLVIAPPIVLGLAIGTATERWLKPGFALLIAVVAALGLGDAFQAWPPEALVPEVLARHDDGSAPGYAAVATAAFIVISLLAGTLGAFLRRTVAASVAAAMAARAELLAATATRHRELEALSGALAHELKNPLASIKGLAVLLARKLPTHSQEAERMGVLLGEVQRMGQILDEFLNFSRPAEGLATSAFPVQRLVTDVCRLYEDDAAQRDVRLRAEVDSTATIVADPRKLKQVLVNLVQNALEASPVGGSVVVRGLDQANTVVFEVQDEGPGLAPELDGRLFTVGATTKAAGTGLGLVIARGIAEQHGGRLDLSNRTDGAGCIARLVVPCGGRATPEVEGPP